MKRITLLMVAFLGAISMNAQSDCANAETVTVADDNSVTVSSTGVTGTAPTGICYSVLNDDTSGMTSGEWYSYTAGSQDVVVTVLANGPADFNTEYLPSFSVFEGACGSLICLGGGRVTSPDSGVTWVPAEVSFLAVAGETYYIVFDDYYAGVGLGTTIAFDFTVTTSTSIPTAPGVVTNPTPADAATDVAIDETDMSVDFAFTAATDGVNVTEYEFYLGTTAPTTYSDLNFLGTLQATSTSVGITGMEYNTEYFWAVVPVNGPVPANSVQVWSFTTEQTAGVEDNQLTEISLYPNPMQDQLSINLPASVELESATMFDLLGQQTVMNIGANNTLNTSNLASGVYILKLETNQGTMTKKVIKQ